MLSANDANLAGLSGHVTDAHLVTAAMCFV